MSLTIHGLGTATPDHGIAQCNAATIAQSICCQNERQDRTVAALYRRAGVKFRHSVALELRDDDEAREVIGCVSSGGVAIAAKSAHAMTTVTQGFFPPAVSGEDLGPTTTERMALYERHAGALGATAVSRALEDASFHPAEITHLVTVSCTGFSAPGMDLSIIRDCGLNRSVARTHVGFMGCHGAINGMRVAQAIAESDAESRVLLCAVELCTLHQQYGWNPDRIISNALFADGAAAMVASSSTSTDLSILQVIATGSTVVPDTEDLMQWRIRDNGFEMTLSPKVPSIIQESLRSWLCDWLATQGRCVDEIGGWAIHPGGPKILQACGTALGFRHEQLRSSQNILAEYGNMSSPTVLFILQRLLSEPAAPPYVMLAFGPGLTIEAALIA